MEKQKTRKPSKSEELAHATERDHAHQSSERITGRLIVLACEAGELEREIVGLQAAMANAKERRARINAVRTGLGAILDKR